MFMIEWSFWPVWLQKSPAGENCRNFEDHRCDPGARSRGFPHAYCKEQSPGVTESYMKQRQELKPITLCSGNLFLT